MRTRHASTAPTVVGYQTIAVQSGFSLVTPTFRNVGTTKMSIADISIVDADGNPSMVVGGVTAQLMDDGGAYLDPALIYFEGVGWLGGDLFDIESGKAICVNNVSGETVYFRYSGEVDLVNKNALPLGFYLWGNATPVDLSMADVTIVDADGNPSMVMGGVTAQLMDDGGAYLDPALIYFDGVGWLGGDVFTLTPGQAACLNNVSGADWFIKVPSPVSE